jgi:hypothetical protein
MPRLTKTLKKSLGLFKLLTAYGKNSGSILAANVVALPVQGGWVVNGEKNLKQALEAHMVGVEVNADNLSMTRSTRADFFIAWLRELTSHIPRLNTRNTPHPLKDRLKAPEAATGKKSCFNHRHDPFNDMSSAQKFIPMTEIQGPKAF